MCGSSEYNYTDADANADAVMLEALTEVLEELEAEAEQVGETV